MARVSAVCPQCRQVITVNDQRETGYCGKCGAEIAVAEAVALFGRESPASASGEPPQGDSLRQQRRAERARELSEKEQQDTARQTIQDMFQLCAGEQDFLMLRGRILDMEITDGEKARLLSILDQETGVRLKDTLKKAKDYEESQQSPVSTLICMVCIAGIGLLINYFFDMKIPGMVAVVLAVIGGIGALQERFSKKTIAENKAAAELIAKYREAGYKI